MIIRSPQKRQSQVNAVNCASDSLLMPPLGCKIILPVIGEASSLEPKKLLTTNYLNTARKVTKLIWS